MGWSQAPCSQVHDIFNVMRDGSREWRAATHDLDRLPFDFAAHNVVPDGYQITEDAVPHAFLLSSRDARVIKEIRGPMTGIILALPDRAVDLKCANRLLEVSKVPHGPSSTLCRLMFFKQLVSRSTCVFGFEYPVGMPVLDWIRMHGDYFDDELACVLCRELLQGLMKQQITNLRFKGFLFADFVFVDDRGRLVSFLPLGALLSWRGFQAALTCFDQNRLAPELQARLKNGEQTEATADLDLYAVGSLLLEVITGATPSSFWRQENDRHLTIAATDFLQRTLYKDPKWRFTLDDAMRHPWLRGSSKSNKAESLHLDHPALSRCHAK